MLLVIHDGLVYRLASFLVRWACGHCKTTFRNYPRGVQPYKRYVFIAVAVLCVEYLQEPSATYRSVVRSAGASKSLPVFYALPEVRADSPEREKELEDPKSLSHLTVWRQMAPLAALERSCGPRRERQLAGADAVDFSPWTIPERKYRSPERLNILIRASQVLAALGLGRSPTDLGTMFAGP